MTNYGKLSLTLWLATILGLIWVYGLVRASRGARRPEARRRAHELRANAKSALDELEPVSVLVSAWINLLPSNAAMRVWPNDLRLVSLLCDGDRSEVLALRKTAEQYIKGLNKFAEMLDYGLVRPKDYFGRYPRDHEHVVLMTHLLAPVVWYESVVRGKGRYGYRVLQLRELTVALRPSSHNRRLLDRQIVTFTGTDCEVLPSVSPSRRALARSRAVLASPAITVRTKVRQNKTAAKLHRELRRAGFEVIDVSARSRHLW